MAANQHEMAALVADVIQDLLPDVRARVDAQVERNLCVAGARAMLVRAVANIVDNALEHGPADGRVRIVARADGARIVVEVHDDGAGIPRDAREQVFEPFYSTREGAAGLGLTVALSVVQAHGGRIELLDGDGCTVRIELPTAVAVASLRHVV